MKANEKAFGFALVSTLTLPHSRHKANKIYQRSTYHWELRRLQVPQILYLHDKNKLIEFD
ncbi:CLUMA_CG012344, isoform A [Clunio marinus]|uniref:CLUMA_CG012344, isoform A n=1 Tax=Clunio marinus TaxID=568069 RepID=A0A1J1IGQ5_9DIPT|nr:CLUMA_CG012344, isoform A [Clunio marinus]